MMKCSTLHLLCDEELSSTLQLLCDEEMLFTSPSPSPAPPRDKKRRCASTESPLLLFDDTDEDREKAFEHYLHTEHGYAPRRTYAEQLSLSSNLSSARLTAVRWIIKGCARHRLSYGTAFCAANYLDRFISMNCCIKKWEGWMIELLSISCLSIASKLDDNVSTPSLHDFQTEDLDHLFQPCTIRRMELAVLKTLDWRLTCVTPYSYVHLLTWRLGLPHNTTSTLTARTTELLLRALQETKMVEYSALAIATSALRCGVEELVPHQSDDACLSLLDRLTPEDRVEEVDRCHEVMEELVVGPPSGSWASSWENCVGGPSSPVTVIPMQRRKILDCQVDIDKCFSRTTTGYDPNPRKRKREEAEGEGVDTSRT